MPGSGRVIRVELGTRGRLIDAMQVFKVDKPLTTRTHLTQQRSRQNAQCGDGPANATPTGYEVAALTIEVIVRSGKLAFMYEQAS